MTSTAAAMHAPRTARRNSPTRLRMTRAAAHMENMIKSPTVNGDGLRALVRRQKWRAGPGARIRRGGAGMDSFLTRRVRAVCRAPAVDASDW